MAVATCKLKENDKNILFQAFPSSSLPLPTHNFLAFLMLVQIHRQIDTHTHTHSRNETSGRPAVAVAILVVVAASVFVFLFGTVVVVVVIVLYCQSYFRQ